MKKIQLLFIGNSNDIINKRKITNWESELFKISNSNINVIENLDNPQCSHGYYNLYMTDSELKRIIPEPAELTIAIANFDLESNFYIRKPYSQCVVLSIKTASMILHEHNIPIELFILKNIYEILTWSYEVNDLSSIIPGTLTHIETRKCLFDMNGQLSDIAKNTITPKICDPCLTRLKNTKLPNNYIRILRKELKRIKQPIIYRIENNIKRKPFISLTITVLATIFINIISNLIFAVIFGA